MNKLARVFLSILFGVLALIWIAPLFFSFMVSFKGAEEYSAWNLLDLPRRLSNFVPNLVAAWKLSEMYASFFNSIFYSCIASVVAIFFASLAAYSLSMLRIKLKTLFFFLIYSGTIFPLQIYLVPLYIMYAKTGIYDTKVGLLLFYIAISIPFCLFVLRNYFTTIPDSVNEAAKLDGASSLRRYASIILPMSIAPLVSLILLQYTWVWNDMIFGLILTKSPNTRPVMVSIMMLSGETVYIGTIPQRVAAALVASFPSFVLFICLRSYFMRGFRMMTLGA